MTLTPEQSEVEIPFIPIVCAAPLMLAVKRRLFEKNGVRVRLRAVPGWSGIKDLVAFGKIDVAHMLCPMPLASHLGINGKPADVRICAIQNIHGQAMTVARRHEGVRDPRQMKGFVFGVPYLYSTQFYLLCDFLAKNGLDPLSDVSIREVAPPRMPSYIERGQLDAILAPEPFNQIIFERGSGFLFALSRDLWPGHPCCVFAAARRFTEESPRTLRALLAGLVEAQRALHAADPAERRALAREIVELGFWRADQSIAVENALAGRVIDGLGGERHVPDRVDFFPHVRPHLVVWLISQMQRWGQIGWDVDYDAVMSAVLLEEAVVRDAAAAAGFGEEPPPIKGLEPTSPRGALEAVKGQPFCVAAPRAREEACYELSDAARARLRAVLSELAEVAGGQRELALDVTSKDEIGWLERMLNDVVRNLKFAREAANEGAEIEDRARRQELVIAAQEELIRELGAPILPVLDGVLVAPIVGRVDAQRASRILEALLDAVSRERAGVVLIDLTALGGFGGVAQLGRAQPPSVDREGDIALVQGLVGMVRAISLLGAECILVGISPSLATAVAAAGVELGSLRTLRDLRSGIEELRSARDRAGSRVAF